MYHQPGNHTYHLRPPPSRPSTILPFYPSRPPQPLPQTTPYQLTRWLKDPISDSMSTSTSVEENLPVDDTSTTTSSPRRSTSPPRNSYAIKTLSSYESLPLLLRKQLRFIEGTFEGSQRISTAMKTRVEKCSATRDSDKRLWKAARRYALLRSLSPRVLLKPEWFGEFTCYTESDNRVIWLEKLIYPHSKELSKNKNVRVLEGWCTERGGKENRVVVKWHKSDSRDIRFETKIYDKLRAAGCPLPWYSTDYLFWNAPVLVLEKLEKLDGTDDEIQLTRDILTQLRFLHGLSMLHSDIKPANVMKKVDPITKERKYYLIDYGGAATKLYKHGWRRQCWSERWTSQPRVKDVLTGEHKPQVTTPVNDFFELALTANSLRRYKLYNHRKFDQDDQSKFDYVGPLALFMDRVLSIQRNLAKMEPNRAKLEPKDYDDLLWTLQTPPAHVPSTPLSRTTAPATHVSRTTYAFPQPNIAHSGIHHFRR